MALRVPILTPLNQLPAGVLIQDPSLPQWVRDLRAASGMPRNEVEALVAQTQTDTLAQVEALIRSHRAFVFRQDNPVTAIDLQHDLDRDGPVAVQVYSLDMTFVWEFFEIHRIDRNTVRLVFDDPTAFNAIVL